MTNLSVVVPVYNDQKVLRNLVEGIIEQANEVTDSIEIVLVNDGSVDGSLDELNVLKDEFSNLKVINLPKNCGQHIATSIGLKAASGSLILMMDSDMQVSPQYLKSFHRIIQEDQSLDIVSAQRLSRSKGLVRAVGSFFVSWLLRFLSGSKLKDIGSTFKLIRRSALDRMLEHDILIQNLPILMLKMNLNIQEFPVKYDKKGKSHYRFKDLFSALLLALLNFSTGQRTLIFLILSGILLFSVSGLVILGIIIQGMIEQTQLPTNFLIFFMVLTVIGVQFILMGVIAFKLERVNRNLEFRKTMSELLDE